MDSAEPKPVTLLPGRVFHGRYDVVRCLRTGGMGAVYEVIDQKTGRRRALKVMLPSAAVDADLRARFKLEATITATIVSDHLVEMVDADIDAETGAPFVVMELLVGEDLGESLARRGALSKKDVVTLLRQAARALDRTHAAGIVHRDLKPENLFVTIRDDGSPRLKVLDFGIAKVVVEDGAPLHTTRAMGTPLYMPPEQIRGDGDIGPAADVYALGQVGYALLVGEPYWTEERAALPAIYAIFSRILAGPSELATDRASRRSAVALPHAFNAWFARATATAPADRFPSATTLIAELAVALDIAVAIEIERPRSPYPAEASGSSDRDALAPAFSGAPTELTASSGSLVATSVGAGLGGPAVRRWAIGAALIAACACALLLVPRGRGAPSAAGEAGEIALAASTPVAPVASTIPSAVAVATAPSLPLPAGSAAAVVATSTSAHRGVIRTRSAASALPAARPAAVAPGSGYDPTNVR